MANEKRCCRNCNHRIDYPKKNAYGDVEHLCTKTGYFVSGLDKDVDKIKRYSPGGKELPCEWEERTR